MRFFTVLSFCLFAMRLSAQEVYADSLRGVLRQELPDTQRVLVLTNLAFAIYATEPKEAIELTGEAIALSENIGYKRGLMKGYYSMAAALLALGNYEDALQACNQALHWAEELKSSNGLRAAFNLKGVVYRQWGKWEEALKPLFSLLELSEAQGFLLDAGLAAQNIASIYIDLKEDDTAKEYLLRAEQYFLKASGQEFLPDVYLNLSSVVEKPEEKLAYLHKALSSDSAPADLVYVYHNLAAVYSRELFVPDSAIYFFDRALEVFGEVDDAFEYASLLVDYGSFLEKLGEDAKAERFLTEALRLSEDLGLKRVELDARQELSKVYVKLGRPEAAYKELSRALDLGDSLFTSSLQEALAEADARYENERNKAKLAEKALALERERSLRMKVIFISLLFLLLVSFAAYFYTLKQKAQKKAAELQARLEQEKADRLRHLNELKSRFFNNIVHEYRTPLTLILGPLENLLQNSKDRALKAELKGVEEQALRLLSLTDEVLALARLEEGEIPLQEHPCLLPQALRRMAMAYVSAAQLKRISWTFSWDGPEDLMAQLDEGKLEIVVNTLLENALKFTKEGGRVEVRAIYADSVLTFSVYNEGEGILSEDLPRIFDRFYRGKHDKGGSGIGLAFAKELCELMGGKIEVESTFGKYALFRATWPLQVLEAGGSNLPPSFEKAWTPDMHHSCEHVVLVVEDEPEMARYLFRLLGDAGYHVLHASEGKAALDLLSRQDVDLILSDISMPGMGGFAFRQMVLKEEKWRDIPFVFLTARAEEEDRIRGFRYGVDDYLVKPFRASELQLRVQTLLERRQLRKKEEAPPLTAEQQFVADLERIVLEHLSDPAFGVEQLAKEARYSRRQLARLLKAATGLSPVQFLLEIRLQQAYRLLKASRYRTVSEVRYEVGIESASYFSRKFSERFGIKPSELSKGNLDT